MVGRSGLPGNAVENAAATTVVTYGGLWTLGFKSTHTYSMKQMLRKLEASDA